MSDKIQAALEARKSRKKKEEESFAEKQKKSQAKIDSALKARESRITNNLQSTFSDFETRINSEIEAIKKISTEDYNEEYNKAIQAQKDYEAMLTYNQESGLRDIGYYENELNAINTVESEINKIKSENQTLELAKVKGSKDAIAKLEANNKRLAILNESLDKALKTYGSKSELQSYISQKKAYHNRAKTIQYGIKLTNDALSAEDFDTSSQYVSTKSDNKWAELKSQYGMGYDDLTYEYINNIDGMRDEIKNTYSTWHRDASDSPYVERGLDHMNEDEVKIYNYYYATEGKEKAEEFLDSIQESLNTRKAAKDFKKYEGNTFAELLFGAEAGLDQFKSGMQNLFNFEDDYIPSSSTQILSGMVREDLADSSIPMWYNFKEGKWEDKVLGNSLGQGAYDLTTTSFNMVPSILTSAAIGTINPVAGQVVGAGLMGASASGNAYAEALNLGYDKGQARMYSGLVGVSEATLQYLLGGIGKLGGGKLTTEAVVKIANNMDNALARIALKLGANAAGEFTEEYLQEVLDPFFRNLTLGTNEDIKLFSTEALYAGILGALSAGVLEGGSTIKADIKTSKLGKSVQKADGGVERLKKLGTTFAADTVAYQIADKVTNETGAYKIGLLLQEVGGTLSEQNVSDITTELTKKGMDNSTAKRIAKSYQAFLNEEMSLTDEQVEVLEGLEPLADVLRKSIIGRNTSVYQRTREYSDLAQLATEMESKATAPQTATEVIPQKTIAPYSKEYMDTVAKEFEDMGMPTEQAKAMAMAQLSRDNTNTSPTKENLAESKFEVSDDGKTTNIKTGESVEIKKIDSISESGEANLTLNDGTVVKASDVSFGSVAERAFVEEIGKIKIGKNSINAASANALYHTAMAELNDNPKMTADEAYALIKGLEGSYIQGVYNFGESQLTEVDENGRARHYAGEISQTRRSFAYNLGKQDSVSKVEAEQKVIDNLKAKADPKLKRKHLGKVVFESNIDENLLDDTKKANLNGIKLLAELTNYEFHVFESDENLNFTMPDGTVRSANGWYVSGTNEIWIDLKAGANAEGTMLWTAGHEISHDIKVKSPKQWKAMADLIMQTFADNDVNVESLLNKQIAKIKRRYRKNNQAMPSRSVLMDMAYEELVSDALSGMLTDGSIVDFIAEVKAKDKNLAQRILDAIKSLLEKWGLIIESYKDRTPDTAEAQALAQFEDTFKKLQEMYRDALMDASEVNAAIGSKNLADEDVKNSFRNSENGTANDFLLPYDNELTELIEKRGNYIIDSFEKLKDIVDLAFDKPQLKATAYFGIIPTGILSKIEKSIPNIPKELNGTLFETDRTYSVAATLDSIQHLADDKNLSRSDIIDYLDRMADTIIDFDTVNFDYYYQGKNKSSGVVFRKTFEDGTMQSFEIVSNKKRTLNLQTLYMESGDYQKKKSAETLLMEKPSANAQGAGRSDSIDSIAQTSKKSQEKIYSERDTDVYTRIYEMQTELNQTNKTILEMQQSEEFKVVHDKLSEAIANDDVDNGIKIYQEWQDKSGYAELSKKRDALQEELKNLRKSAEEERVDKALFEEKKAIADSGLSEADYFRKQAVKEFGYTPYFYDAGYIVPNGKMLNFSGEKGKHFGSRGEDHRGIGKIYANSQGSKALTRFMNDGNIRIMAESPGIDVFAQAEPTSEQYNTIRKFATEYAKEGYFNVDISDESGKVIGNLEYENNINPTRIINDIKHYYATGEIRQQSNVSKFLYSDRDSEGNELSKEQQEFFKDSKVRDDDGNLLVVYHGTRKADFTVFKRNVNFFTDSKEMADSYAPNSEGYVGYLKIANPFIIDAAGEKWSKIPIDENIKSILLKYGAGVFKENGKWRTTPADIASAIQDGIDDGEFDYDGVIIKNVDDTGSYYKGKDNIVATDYITFNSSQFKNIDNKMPTSDPDIRYSERDYAPTFYSQMGKVVEGVKQEKLAANSVVNMLRGKGVKAEEIRWSGIVPFLEGKKSVTKQELLDFINGSMLQIGEQMSSNNIDLRYDGSTHTYSLYDENGNVVNTFTYNEFMGGYVSENDDEIYTNAVELEDALREEYGSMSSPRWSQYKLDGGTNYREIVFTLPNSTYTNRAMKVHWGQDAEGVLVHARIQDFDVNGKKMLFIEEIQSDWHNEGNKVGYAKNLLPTEIKRIAELNKAQSTLVEEMQEKYQKGDINGAMELHEQERKLYLERQKIEGNKDGTPDAPFKDTYHEYVLKRLIRMAAEQGYDSIGWTPADIQSDRWSDEFAEGYRIEYDQEMPKFLRKYGRQWGATVGNTDIQTKHLSIEEEMDNALLEDWIIDDDAGETEESVAEQMRKWKGLTSVWSMDITDSMKESVLYEGQVMYSERDTSSSNRSILANALEGAAQDDIEKEKLKQYKEKISLIESEEKRLSEIQKQLFTKGGVEPTQRKDLQFEARQIANRITTYDRQLLNLESTTALKNVLNREKELARKRQKQIDNEILKGYREKAAKNVRELMDRNKESRKKATESRQKTALRHQIKSVVSELNTLLTHGNKKRHVPEDLKVAVAEVLELFNMDAVGAEERIAKLKQELMKAKTPEKIQEISRKIDNIQTMGDRMNARLNKLKTAYDAIKNSADSEIVGGFDVVVSSRIEYVAFKVGKTPLRNMTLEQLGMVYDVYTMVLSSIRDANSLFKKDKAETIQNYASRVVGEVRQAGGEHKFTSPRTDTIKEFLWNNLKPIFAFEKIGSKTLTDLYEDVRSGEDTWAVDITEAKDFADSKYDKYNYKKWDFDKKYTFKSTTGEQFSLTLDQMLSLYAYSKRPQAGDHLRIGGFVFDDSITTYKDKENGKKSILKYKVNIASAHQINIYTLSDIVGSLSDEQRAFVDEMQTYLSDVMGAKGNEVSMTLYNIRLFKEKNYFPLKSAKQFMFEQNEVAGEVKIKNSGFTEGTVEHANNPIILSNFIDVWANHVNDMAMYHSFVVPLENFNRVFNYQTRRAVGMPAVSVKETLQNAYGSHAVSYIRQLLTDLNGGARSDPRESTSKKLLSLFKKAKVFASMSVVIQQPSAVGRALALIDAKYFDFNPKLISHNKLWAEVKKYAPVAIIKEMGRFDTDMGRSTVEYIKDQKTLLQIVDDVLSIPPSLADELTWVHIWEAVKRETKATHKDLQVGSEEFLKAAGKRFTEVITKTQVYDSVLSRSANMRSKSVFMSMMTAFMAEPTTAINMVEQGLRSMRRGDKKSGLKQLRAVGASVILNAALVSLVYAMRDDDEDETFLEKYLGSLASETVDGLNPLTYFPIVKDVWSLMQGYSVARSDMALISDIVSTMKGFAQTVSSYGDDMTDEEMKTFKKGMIDNSLKLADGIAAMFGIPAENIQREINSIINTYKTLANGFSTSKLSLKNELVESVKDITPIWGWLPDEQKTDKLYEAILSGDTTYADRLKSGYKDDKAIESALKKALRENDPRIKEAAEARVNGDFDEYERLFNEIEGEGNFEFNTIKSAISTEFNKLNDSSEGETSDDDDDVDKAESIYKTSDMNLAFEKGNTSSALEVIDDIVKVKTENYINEGETKKDAEKKAKSSVKSSMTSYWKPLYLEAYKNGDNNEMKRIRNILLSSGLYGRANDVIKTGQDWVKNSKK